MFSFIVIWKAIVQRSCLHSSPLLDRADSLRVFLSCHYTDFSGGLVVENIPANAGDSGLIPDLGKSYMSQGNKGPCAATVELVLRTSASLKKAASTVSSLHATARE